MSRVARVFEDAAPELTFEVAPTGGAFVSARWSVASARERLRLGSVRGVRRLVACYRPEPFWMQPRVGSAIADVPRDTQFLLIELGDASLLLVVPLVRAPFKATLEGDAEGQLWLVLDSGDAEARGCDALAAYVASGEDAYVMCREGALAVAERLQTFTLRRHKARPAFADYFGWCTWDAFYQEVSEEKLAAGLRAFRSGGVEPRFVILDDGWQSVKAQPSGAPRLSALGANAKFPGGLAACVSRMKRDHGVRYFMVWHAVHGYWGGIDRASLDDYGVEEIERSYGPEVLSHFPSANREYWGASVGRPALSLLARFYDDYHGELRRSGVDGVKVDNQASVEGLARGQGGRVEAMLGTRAALESSASRHFGSELINCMSCSSEMFYTDRSAALTRTSTDFWPNRPDSHGLHVHTNALVGLWFGEIVHPDWDMFQSAHAAGRFHAVARAVSGSAVYVSDRPGEHDFGLLAELVCSDGRVLRAEGVAVPTRDSLFVEPVSGGSLFKVVNHLRVGWVIGVFNATLERTLSGSVAPTDVPGLEGAEFGVYLKHADRLLRLARGALAELTLAPLSAEVVTLARLEGGVAVLGLSNKLCGGAAVLAVRRSDGWLEVELGDGGQLLLLSDRTPRAVTSDGAPVNFAWVDQRLDVRLPEPGRQLVRIELEPG